MRISTSIENWPLAAPFRIANKEYTSIDCLVVDVSDGRHSGRGEAQGVDYLGETPASMQAAVGSVAGSGSDLTRATLQGLLPAGGARNALDCALWDLDAKRSGQSIWALTGIEPAPVTTVYTIGLEAEPEAMAARARDAAVHPVLKIKLSADRPVERLRAIRDARPDATLVADANQGLSMVLLEASLPAFVDCGLAMLEQPLPRGGDADLLGFDSPIPLAADESCQDRSELDYLVGRYDMVNVKLDKTGGLTEALALVAAARERGLRLMVGNMVGTSLSMAPAFVIAQSCEFVDIDGPLLMADDRPHGLQYAGGTVSVFDASLWG